MTTTRKSSNPSPEIDQRMEWVASWLRYVRSVIPLNVSGPARQRAIDAAEKLLRELDRSDYNAIVLKQLVNVVHAELRF